MQGHREYMEDVYIQGKVPGGNLYAVFDGHGGASTSGHCERWFLHHWKEQWENRKMSEEPTNDEVKEFIEYFLPYFDSTIEVLCHTYRYRGFRSQKF